MDELTGFITIARGGWTAVVRERYAEALAAPLLTGSGTMPWQTEGGRGAVERAPLPEGEAVIRRFRRGGLVRHVLHDGYLLDNRPLRELRVHCHCHAAGLPVPEPLGACWRWRGPFVRGAIATRRIDASELAGILRGDGDHAALLTAAGRVIRRMHDAGVLHADLQVHNILASDNEVWLLDFDRARAVGRAGRVARASNLLRLRRSVEKAGLPSRMFDMICESYGEIVVPRWLDRAYRLRGRFSGATSGRRGA